jgi:hypothetical protein
MAARAENISPSIERTSHSDRDCSVSLDTMPLHSRDTAFAMPCILDEAHVASRHESYGPAIDGRMACVCSALLGLTQKRRMSAAETEPKERRGECMPESFSGGGPWRALRLSGRRGPAGVFPRRASTGAGEEWLQSRSRSPSATAACLSCCTTSTICPRARWRCSGGVGIPPARGGGCAFCTTVG